MRRVVTMTASSSSPPSPVQPRHPHHHHHHHTNTPPMKAASKTPSPLSPLASKGGDGDDDDVVFIIHIPPKSRRVNLILANLLALAIYVYHQLYLVQPAVSSSHASSSSSFGWYYHPDDENHQNHRTTSTWITLSSSSSRDTSSSFSSSSPVMTVVGNLYLCGFAVASSRPTYASMFPRHQHVPLMNTSSGWTAPPVVTAHDVVVIMGGQRPEPACPLAWWNHSASTFRQWLKNIPAKVLLTNGESHGSFPSPTRNIYQIGYHADDPTQRTMRLRFVQWVLMEYGPDSWPQILDPTQKPHSRAERFLVYAASKCVEHRERAVDHLSEIGIVDQGGKCGGLLHRPDRFRPMPDLHQSRFEWSNNAQHFTPYRFCLVLENKRQDGYITEKILNAYLAGCIPIYYGPDEIFDLFHRDSFIFYNISNPQPAWDRIHYLEHNRTAYHEMQQQTPILANGADTVREYFSLTQAMGGEGALMKKLHAFMGLPPPL